MGNEQRLHSMSILVDLAIIKSHLSSTRRWKNQLAHTSTCKVILANNRKHLPFGRHNFQNRLNDRNSRHLLMLTISANKVAQEDLRKPPGKQRLHMHIHTNTTDILYTKGHGST